MTSNILQTPFDIHYLVLDNIINDSDPQNIYGSFSFPFIGNEKTFIQNKNLLSEPESLLDSGSDSLSSFLNDFEIKDLFLKSEIFYTYYQTLKIYYATVSHLINSSSILKESFVALDFFLRDTLLTSNTASDVASHLYVSDFSSQKDIDHKLTTAFLEQDAYRPKTNTVKLLSSDDISFVNLKNYSKQDYTYNSDYLTGLRLYSNQLSTKIFSISFKIKSSSINDFNIISLFNKSISGLKSISANITYLSGDSETIERSFLDKTSDMYKLDFAFSNSVKEIGFTFSYNNYSGKKLDIPYYDLLIEKIILSKSESKEVSVVTDFISFPISDNLNYKIASFLLSLKGTNTDRILSYYSLEKNPHQWNLIDRNSPTKISDSFSLSLLSKTIPFPQSPNTDFAVLESKLLGISLDTTNDKIIDTDNAFLLRNIHSLETNNNIWIKDASFYKANLLTPSFQKTIDFGPNFLYINDVLVSGKFIFQPNRLYRIKILEKNFIDIDKNDLSLFPSSDPFFPFNQRFLLEGSIGIEEYPETGFILSSYKSNYIPYQLIHYLSEEDKNLYYSLLLDNEGSGLFVLTPLTKDFSKFYIEKSFFVYSYRTHSTKEEKFRLRFDIVNTETLPVIFSGFTCKVI